MRPDRKRHICTNRLCELLEHICTWLAAEHTYVYVFSGLQSNDWKTSATTRLRRLSVNGEPQVHNDRALGVPFPGASAMVTSVPLTICVALFVE